MAEWFKVNINFIDDFLLEIIGFEPITIFMQRIPSTVEIYSLLLKLNQNLLIIF